jgi:hypothetical protein
VLSLAVLVWQAFVLVSFFLVTRLKSSNVRDVNSKAKIRIIDAIEVLLPVAVLTLVWLAWTHFVLTPPLSSLQGSVVGFGSGGATRIVVDRMPQADGASRDEVLDILFVLAPLLCLGPSLFFFWAIGLSFASLIWSFFTVVPAAVGYAFAVSLFKEL